RGKFRPWLWAAAVAVPVLAFFLGTPYAFLDLPAYLRGPEAAGTATLARAGTSALVADLVRELGWLVCALAAAGWVALALERRGWIVLLFPAGLALLAPAIGLD